MATPSGLTTAHICLKVVTATASSCRNIGSTSVLKYSKAVSAAALITGQYLTAAACSQRQAAPTAATACFTIATPFKTYVICWPLKPIRISPSTPSKTLPLKIDFIALPNFLAVFHISSSFAFAPSMPPFILINQPTSSPTPNTIQPIGFVSMAAESRRIPRAAAIVAVFIAAIPETTAPMAIATPCTKGFISSQFCFM